MTGEKRSAGGGRDGSADWEAAGGAVGVSADVQVGNRLGWARGLAAAPQLRSFALGAGRHGRPS